MIRRLFTIASVFSLSLCVVVTASWLRRQGHSFEGIEVTTRGGTQWQFWSGSRLGMQHIANWPEKPGIRHSHYRVDQEQPMIADHSMALIVYSYISGANSRGSKQLGIAFNHGKCCVAVSSDLTVRRMPPFRANILDETFSAPLPFWELDLPHWQAAAIFGLLPLLLIAIWTRARLIRQLRLHQSRCSICGYDLRASPDRCPECGTPIPAKDNATT